MFISSVFLAQLFIYPGIQTLECFTCCTDNAKSEYSILLVNIQKATNSEAESPLARAERLDKLYTRLANKDISERAAQELVSVIERVWLDSGSHTVDFLMERALAATRSQNYDISIQILNRVVELAPDYAEGWNQLAVAYYLSENFDQTLPPLLRALSLDRRHFKAIEGYGVLMREMGNKRAALSAFRRVLVINPRSSSAREAEAELSREIDGQGI